MLHSCHYGLLDLAIVYHILVVICAPAAEEVNQGLAIEWHRELLPEAQFELSNAQETVLIIINVFSSTPYSCSFVRVPRHDWCEELLVGLYEAL